MKYGTSSSLLSLSISVRNYVYVYYIYTHFSLFEGSGVGGVINGWSWIWLAKGVGVWWIIIACGLHVIFLSYGDIFDTLIAIDLISYFRIKYWWDSYSILWWCYFVFVYDLIRFEENRLHHNWVNYLFTFWVVYSINDCAISYSRMINLIRIYGRHYIKLNSMIPKHCLLYWLSFTYMGDTISHYLRLMLWNWLLVGFSLLLQNILIIYILFIIQRKNILKYKIYWII